MFRFHDDDAKSGPLFDQPFSTRLASGDVFSLGCVLAELFLSGTALFELPELLAYRKGDMQQPEALQRIQNPAARELISDMIQRDPARRKTSIQYLRLWCERVFPPCFRTCLFPMFCTLLNPVYQNSDARVLFIHKNLEMIICSIVGPAGVEKWLGPGDWRQVVRDHVRANTSRTLADPITTEQVLGQDAIDFPHPQLRAASGARFTKQMLSAWEHAAIAASAPNSGGGKTPPQSFSASAAGVFAALFPNNGDNWGKEADDEISQEQAQEDEEASRGCYDPLALSVVIGVIGAALQHVAAPRLRIGCLQMLQCLARLASQQSILEQIIPYTHQVLLDHSAPVRRQAIVTLSAVLKDLDLNEPLPKQDEQMFQDYLLPQLATLVSDNEPVVLVALAKHITPIAERACKLLDVTQQANKQAEQAEQADRDEAAAAESASLPYKVRQEGQPVQQVLAVVEKIVKALLGGGLSGMAGSSSGQDQSVTSTESGENKEPSIIRVVTSRAVKLALLENMERLSALFDRKATQNVLLPYVISFMNDGDAEVRAAFCRSVPSIGQLLGAVSTEGIILPCLIEAIVDVDEMVSVAAVEGLSSIVAGNILPPRVLTTLLRHVPQLLLHPSRDIRVNAFTLLQGICAKMSHERVLVYVLPALTPVLAYDIISLEELSSALLPPLSRQAFQHLKDSQELREVVAGEAPLTLDMVPVDLPPSVDNPMSGVDAYANTASQVHQTTIKRANERREDDLAAMIILRQFLRQLFSKTKNVQNSRQVTTVAEVLVPQDLQRAQAGKGNPYVQANQPLQVRAELRHIMNHINPAFDEPTVEEEDGPFASAHSSQLAPTSGQTSSQEKLKDSSIMLGSSATDWRTLALGLPAFDPAPLNIGHLTNLDGTSYSLYESKTSAVGVEIDADPWATSTADPNAFNSGNAPVNVFGQPIEGQQEAWKPNGHLVGTLYEYAHGAVAVTRVDGTDDGRVLVATGSDGTIKIWNASQVEKDVAVHSLRTFKLPDTDLAASSDPNWSFRPALRTMRDSKAFAVGSDRGNVYLYRLEAGRSATAPAPLLHNSAHTGQGCITTLEHFDTDLESMVLYTQQGGGLHGWDVRCRSTAWSMEVPPWCGVPYAQSIQNFKFKLFHSKRFYTSIGDEFEIFYCFIWNFRSAMAVGHDGHTVTVGTLGGALLLYDLRFLSPLKTLKLSSGVPILDLRPDVSREAPSVFAALGSNCNEVALFDVANSRCVSLFMTHGGQHQEPVQVPTLLDATCNRSASTSACRLSVGTGVAAQHGITPDGVHINLRSACRSTNCVRSLWTVLFQSR